MSGDLRVAFVGAGNMGHEHARAFRGLDGVQLAGVFSKTESRAQALATEHQIPVVCASVDELFARSRADLVVVAVHELSVNSIARQCFRYPWTVLLEKPAGYNVRDAEDILSAAQAAQARAYVALNRRCYGSTLQGLQLINASDPGGRLISIQDQQDLRAVAAMGVAPEVMSNYMFANSIHVIDYFRVFGRGKVRSVNPLVPWNPARPGLVVAQLEFDSGDIGVYQAVWDGPGPWAVAATNSQVRVEMRPLESLAVQRRGERRLTPVELGTLDVEYKPGLRVQAMRAVGAVRGDPGPVGLATLEEATESMRLVGRIYAMR